MRSSITTIGIPATSKERVGTTIESPSVGPDDTLLNELPPIKSEVKKTLKKADTTREKVNPLGSSLQSLQTAVSLDQICCSRASFEQHVDQDEE